MEKSNERKINNIKNEKNQKNPLLNEKMKGNKDDNVKKNKGYTKIFRNLIKRKQNILKNILDNKFTKWKKEAFKDTFFLKKILIRISVSKDDIFKNRFNSNRLNKENYINKNKQKNLSSDCCLTKNKKEKIKDNNITISNIKRKNVNDFDKKEKSNENMKEIPLKSLYKNDKTSLTNTSFQKIKQNNNIIITSNYSNNISIPKTNITKNMKKTFDKKNEIAQYNYPKPVPTLYTYDPNKNKNLSKNVNHNKIINKTKNITNNIYTKINNYGTYNNYTNSLSPIRPQINNNQSKNKDIITPYSFKKYKNPNRNYSEKAIFNKDKSITNTFQIKNINKLYSPDERIKFNNYTARIKDKKLEKEKLKKGITTVIQHYFGVRETFNNYNLLPNF